MAEAKEFQGFSAAFRISVYEQVRSKALVDFKSVHYTFIRLAAVAMKYNYTSDLRYIPCEPQNTAFPKAFPNEPNKIVRFWVRRDFYTRLQAVKEASCEFSTAAAFRSLVETALIYDYNKNLFFQKPVPIAAPSPANPKDRSNSVILLDMI